IGQENSQPILVQTADEIGRAQTFAQLLREQAEALALHGPSSQDHQAEPARAAIDEAALALEEALELARGEDALGRILPRRLDESRDPLVAQSSPHASTHVSNRIEERPVGGIRRGRAGAHVAPLLPDRRGAVHWLR